jgi:hypothetical protein
MARQCPCDHDGIKPGEVTDDMLTYHLTRRAPNLAKEMAKQLEVMLEVAMAKIQRIGGEGDKSAQGQSTRSRGQAGASSPDLSTGTHLSGGLRRSSSESSAAAVRRCSHQSERGGYDRSVWPRPPGWVQPGRLAPIGGPGPTGGPGLAGERVGFIRFLK